MRKWLKRVIAGCILMVLIWSASAFSVGSVSIAPSGNLYPGNSVNVSYTVYAASGTAFPIYDDLQFITELDDPKWTYSIEVNGANNYRPVTGGKTLTINGFELGYRNQDEVTVRTNLQGTIPAGSVIGTNKTLVKIQELDARGNSIPYSIVKLDHLVGEPTPPPTPAFGSIFVTTSPPGANIYIDNVYKGLSPATFDTIPNGIHVVLIKMDGYGDFSKTIYVTADTQTVDAALSDKPTTSVFTVSAVQTTHSDGGSPTPVIPAQTSEYGSLSVTTSPPGARVYIDGSMKGVTPATIPMLAQGSHDVVLVMEGYQDLKTTITINAGTTSEYITGLSKNTKTPGFGMGIIALSFGILLLIRKLNL